MYKSKTTLGPDVSLSSLWKPLPTGQGKQERKISKNDVTITVYTSTFMHIDTIRNSYPLQLPLNRYTGLNRPKV